MKAKYIKNAQGKYLVSTGYAIGGETFGWADKPDMPWNGDAARRLVATMAEEATVVEEDLPTKATLVHADGRREEITLHDSSLMRGHPPERLHYSDGRRFDLNTYQYRRGSYVYEEEVVFDGSR